MSSLAGCAVRTLAAVAFALVAASCVAEAPLLVQLDVQIPSGGCLQNVIVTVDDGPRLSTRVDGATILKLDVPATGTETVSVVIVGLGEGDAVLAHAMRRDVVVSTITSMMLELDPGVVCVPGATGSRIDAGVKKDQGAASDGGGVDAEAPDVGPSDVMNADVEAKAKAGNGLVCAVDADCASNACVDKICCDRACSGPCLSCAMPDRLGTCTAKTGTICAPAQCKSGGALAPASTCDKDGKCVAAAERTCVPWACDAATNTCFDKCTTSSQCSDGKVCVGGSCGKKALGAACMSAAECNSNFCVDGVCCGDACQGACRQCNGSGVEGKCSEIIGRTDPGLCDGESTCDAAGACKKAAGKACSDKNQCATGSCVNDVCCKTSSCGLCQQCNRNGEGSCSYAPVGASDGRCQGNVCLQGTCDGAGACTPKPVGTMCAQSSCKSVTVLQTSACNEAGACVAEAKTCSGTETCKDAVCAPKHAEGGSCMTATDCLSGLACAGGKCQKADAGVPVDAPRVDAPLSQG